LSSWKNANIAAVAVENSDASDNRIARIHSLHRASFSEGEQPNADVIPPIVTRKIDNIAPAPPRQPPASRSQRVPKSVPPNRVNASTDAFTRRAEHRAVGNGTRSSSRYVDDPKGNAFRLVHVDGTGWKYVAGWQTSDGRVTSLLRKVTFRAAPPTAASAVPSAEPLTVFIDGPSGYTFVWTREGAWKFVGKIAGRRS
jgi:hypothetical protein